MQNILKTIFDAINGREKNFTSGSINKAILMLSIPMVLEMAMESLFALVDVFFVSQVSPEAVATVGLTESVITLVYAIAIGMSTAPMAMIARYVGEGDHSQASKVVLQAVYLAIGISLLIGIPGYFFASKILSGMGGSEELVASGTGYTQVMFASNIFIMLLFLLNGIFRGAGDAHLAMRALWLANGINIILDPILIFGWGPIPAMGVQGAAVATTIGRGLGVAFQLYLLLKGASVVRLYLKELQIQFSIMRKLLKIALNGALQFLIASASWIVLMRIVAQFGSEAVAGYVIAIRLIIFTLLPSWGIANAAATLVGQNLGAGHPDRAATSVWRAAYFSMIFLASVAAIYFFGASTIVYFFTDDQAVVDAGILSLRIFAISYALFAYGMVIGQAFNGAGDTRTPMIINLICFWAVEIPLAYFLALYAGWGLAGVCWAIAGSETLMTILSIILFRQGKWKTVEI
ncbi:MAG: MATE family efflux transporter [Saprospiraceae bacterium]|nr:MATE family efflux transporter [Saprospiraceae bacterium]